MIGIPDGFVQRTAPMGCAVCPRDGSSCESQDPEAGLLEAKGKRAQGGNNSAGAGRKKKARAGNGPKLAYMAAKGGDVNGPGLVPLCRLRLREGGGRETLFSLGCWAQKYRPSNEPSGSAGVVGGKNLDL